MLLMQLSQVLDAGKGGQQAARVALPIQHGPGALQHSQVRLHQCCAKALHGQRSFGTLLQAGCRHTYAWILRKGMKGVYSAQACQVCQPNAVFVSCIPCMQGCEC